MLHKSSHYGNDNFKPVPSVSFELVDYRLPTQEGKQTSQESASPSESKI